jgi:hypothetical protein
VAVHATDHLVDDSEGLGFEGAPLLALRVVQVVGVDDAHHVLELVRPAPAMVVPIQVLRLLQDRHISLQQRQVTLLSLRASSLLTSHPLESPTRTYGK